MYFDTKQENLLNYSNFSHEFSSNRTERLSPKIETRYTFISLATTKAEQTSVYANISIVIWLQYMISKSDNGIALFLSYLHSYIYLLKKAQCFNNYLISWPKEKAQELRFISLIFYFLIVLYQYDN